MKLTFKQQIELLDEQEMKALLIEQNQTISEATAANLAHCDLLAGYIVRYCKDKFDDEQWW